MTNPSQTTQKANSMVRRLIAIFLFPLTLSSGAVAEDEALVQSLLLRSVIVTHDLDASVQFYRDILGQEIIEERTLNAKRSQSFLDVSEGATVTFMVFAGRGEYPGGPIQGGRIALMGIDDPQAAPSAVAANRRGQHGDMILPHRVGNLDEIYSQIVDAELEVLYPPRTSSTGRSRTMMVFSPTGQIVELFELFDSASKPN
jgi:catechol 2,3-dioxygenase-like lactoylglutathione lyase family enzyme